MSSEFNFDELDRAVNSLIGDQASQGASLASPSSNPQPAPPPASPSPAPPPVGTQSVSSRDSSVSTVPPRAIPQPERPVVSNNASSPAPPAQQQASSVQAAASPQASPISSPPATSNLVTPRPRVERPGSGRAMDVVQPGSDSATSPIPSIKRGAGAEGKTVSPLSSNITPDPLPENSEARTPNSAQLSIKSPINPDSLTKTPDTEEQPWQDPLEVAKKESKENLLKNDALTRLSNTPLSEDTAAKDEKPNDDAKPLFLPDAKVEKRPLGAFAADEDKKEVATDTSKDEEGEKAPKLTINGVEDLGEKDKKEDEANEPLPPELGREIVAVEAGGEIANSEEEAGLNDKSRDDNVKVKKDEKKENLKPATFSIPRQYKEKQVSEGAKPKSIYDTEEYHQSIISNAKKQQKNSKKWLVWVLVAIGLLVVGIGLGAGAYFLIGI